MGKVIPFDEARQELIGRRLATEIEKLTNVPAPATAPSAICDAWGFAFAEGFGTNVPLPSDDFFIPADLAPASAPATAPLTLADLMTPEEIKYDARQNLIAARTGWLLEL
jgi:hypothetical protein